MISYDVKTETTIEYGEYSIIIREIETEEGEPAQFDYCVISPDESETDYVGFVASEAEAIKQGKAWADDIQHERETDFVASADAFTGKLGTSQDYAWMVEGVDRLEDYTDELITALVDQNAETVFDNTQNEYEERFGQKLTMSLEDFKKWSDYKWAMKETLRRRDDARAERTLNEVMTAAEVMEEYGLSESTVRQALNRESLRGRKSGETWLVLRKDAEARWGKK